MITFSRTVIEGKYKWIDAVGNELQIDPLKFDNVNLVSKYQDSAVTVQAVIVLPFGGAMLGDPNYVTHGVTFEFVLDTLPVFKAQALSVDITDAEFVRAVRAGAIRVISPGAAYLT